jgi:hypothetical protein
MYPETLARAQDLFRGLTPAHIERTIVRDPTYYYGFAEWQDDGECPAGRAHFVSTNLQPDALFYGLEMADDWFGTLSQPLEHSEPIVGPVEPGQPTPHFRWWTPLGSSFGSLLAYIRNPDTIESEDEAIAMMPESSLKAAFITLVFCDDVEAVYDLRDRPPFTAEKPMEHFVAFWARKLERRDWWDDMVQLAGLRDYELSVQVRVQMHRWLTRHQRAA